MAQNISVGTVVEIIPGISPDVFGGGGVLTRDEYNIKDYQTNMANVERIGSSGNPNLPEGTVLVCHGQNCSMYSIRHIRPYNPDEENNVVNNSENNEPSAINSNNARNNNPSEGNNIFGGRRRTRKSKKSSNRKFSRRR
jgi:hypothetical protein